MVSPSLTKAQAAWRRPFDRLRAQLTTREMIETARASWFARAMSPTATARPSAQHAALLDPAGVHVAAAEADAECPGERGLDHAGVRARVLPGISSYGPQRHRRRTTDQRRGHRSRQPRHPGRHPVGQVVQPGRRPAEAFDSAASGARPWRPGCSPPDSRAGRERRPAHPRAAARPPRPRCSRPPTPRWPGRSPPAPGHSSPCRPGCGSGPGPRPGHPPTAGRRWPTPPGAATARRARPRSSPP